MTKCKYTGVFPRTFDYEGGEKTILPGHSYELEINPYIEGLIGIGDLEPEAEPKAETEKSTKKII